MREIADLLEKSNRGPALRVLLDLPDGYPKDVGITFPHKNKQEERGEPKAV